MFNFFKREKKKPVLVMKFTEQIAFKNRMKNIYKFAKRNQIKNELKKV